MFQRGSSIYLNSFKLNFPNLFPRGLQVKKMGRALWSYLLSGGVEMLRRQTSSAEHFRAVLCSIVTGRAIYIQTRRIGQSSVMEQHIGGIHIIGVNNFLSLTPRILSSLKCQNCKNKTTTLEF